MTAAVYFRRALVGLALAGAVGGTVFVVDRAPEQLARIEVFRVRDVAVEGVRWTRALELRAHLALPDSASVWHDLDAWARRLEQHEMIVSATVRRRLPSTLVFSVREREPVALLSTPTLVPVDRDGRPLPIDLARVSVDLPIVEANDLPGGTRTALHAVERMRVDPAFFAELSAVDLAADDELVAWWGADPVVAFRLDLPLEPHRLAEGVQVYEDARQRFPDRPLREVDLRFVEQVVVRF